MALKPEFLTTKGLLHWMDSTGALIRVHEQPGHNPRVHRRHLLGRFLPLRAALGVQSSSLLPGLSSPLTCPLAAAPQSSVGPIPHPTPLVTFLTQGN